MTRRRATAGSLAAALVLALLGVALGTRAATAEIAREAFSVSFHDLLPGETRTETIVIEVPVDAVLATTAAEAEEGVSPDIVWDLGLCPVGGGRCVDIPAPGGTPVAAGDHELTVSATLVSAAAPAGQYSAVVGHLALVEDVDDELARTGASVAGVVALALGLVALGYLLLFAGRGRDGDEEGVTA